MAVMVYEVVKAGSLFASYMTEAMAGAVALREGGEVREGCSHPAFTGASTAHTYTSQCTVCGLITTVFND